jgi:hypothetical protein
MFPISENHGSALLLQMIVRALNMPTPSHCDDSRDLGIFKNIFSFAINGEKISRLSEQEIIDLHF